MALALTPNTKQTCYQRSGRLPALFLCQRCLCPRIPTTRESSKAFHTELVKISSGQSVDSDYRQTTHWNQTWNRNKTVWSRETSSVSTEPRREPGGLVFPSTSPRKNNLHTGCMGYLCGQFLWVMCTSPPIPPPPPYVYTLCEHCAGLHCPSESRLVSPHWPTLAPWGIVGLTTFPWKLKDARDEAQVAACHHLSTPEGHQDSRRWKPQGLDWLHRLIRLQWLGRGEGGGAGKGEGGVYCYVDVVNIPVSCVGRRGTAGRCCVNHSFLIPFPLCPT